MKHKVNGETHELALSGRLDSYEAKQFSAKAEDLWVARHAR